MDFRLYYQSRQHVGTIYKMNVFLTLSCLLIFIILYFIMAQYFGHRRFNYLQETSIAIIVGIIVGVIIFETTDFFQQNQGGSQNFIRDMIMLILLPPIMFEDGYNFPRRKFFQNILYINLFGLLGTIINFFIIWGMLYGFNQAKLFVSVSDAQESIILNNWQILLIATALCSIEPIVTQKSVDKERYPKLFSIVFGQALFKDTLSVTFFQSIIETVMDSGDSTFDIGGQEIGMLILKFLQVIVCSVLLGVVMGILLTIVFKNMRFLVKQKGISEMALTIIVGFLSYVLSQWAGWSGVISMLFCGTVMAHYNSYNLTEQGKQTTLVTIQVLKIAASGVIFFFIGFEIFNIQSFTSVVDGLQKYSFSVALLGFTFLALIVGRIINVFFLSLGGWLLTKKQNWRLNMYQICIIFLAGLVHGAVPFALSVNISLIKGDATCNCTQLNIIAVVMITSLIFNIFIPKLQKILLVQIREMEKNQANHPSVKESFGIHHKNDSHHNAQLQELATPLLDKFKSSTQRYWRKFQQGILKPFLIYNYRQRREQIKLQKVRLRFEQHQRYMQRFEDPENILNIQNQDQNKFIEIKHSENSASSEEGEKGVLKIKKMKKKKEKKKKEKKEKLIIQVNSDRNLKLQKSLEKQSQMIKSSVEEISAKSFRLSEKLQRKKFRLTSQNQMRRPSETEIVSLPSKKKQEVLSEDLIEIKIEIKEEKNEKVEKPDQNVQEDKK